MPCGLTVRGATDGSAVRWQMQLSVELELQPDHAGVCEHVLVVGFDHDLGNIVEFAHPVPLPTLPPASASVGFRAVGPLISSS